MVKAAQKAKELDAKHVGIGKAYQTAPEKGIETTAAEFSVKAKEKAAPLVEKAKIAGSNVAEQWKSFDERNQVSEKTAAAAVKTKEAVKEGFHKLSLLDDQYQVSQKLHAGMVKTAGASGTVVADNDSAVTADGGGIGAKK